ncbi:MAG: Hsp20/alpha crystallin family protein [Deltaproteobacteria bacterium]|nr:Hsp20/alpha crystallin family protein [Deltaproteobacteria bacterium]
MIFRRTSNWPAFYWRSPFGDIERLKRQMDLLSEGIFGGASSGPSPGVFPLMNLTEDKDNYYIRAELPGIKYDELDISVTGDTLSISGERKISEEKGEVKYHRREREGGKFSRIVNLPTQINTAKVDAKCGDELLTITMPKAETAKQKQIVVKAS